MPDQYITCYVNPDGKLVPMGEAKDWDYAKRVAKKHGHVICKLVIVKNKND